MVFLLHDGIVELNDEKYSLTKFSAKVKSIKLKIDLELSPYQSNSIGDGSQSNNLASGTSRSYVKSLLG